MFITVPGLVLKESLYNDNLTCLTVLTGERGKITVLTKESKSAKNRNRMAAQLLFYSELVLQERGGSFWLKEASIIESFPGIRDDIEGNLLAYYIADVANEVCVENSNESDMLSLALNSLYMIAQKTKPLDQIKAAFELRCALVSGFAPELSGCFRCGRDFDRGDRIYLDVMNGVLKCGECLDEEEDNPSAYDTGTATLLIPLSFEVLCAMRYTVSCDPKRIFAFSLPDQLSLSMYSAACEKYLVNHVDKKFETLEMYRHMAGGSVAF